MSSVRLLCINALSYTLWPLLLLPGGWGTGLWALPWNPNLPRRSPTTCRHFQLEVALARHLTQTRAVLLIPNKLLNSRPLTLNLRWARSSSLWDHSLPSKFLNQRGSTCTTSGKPLMLLLLIKFRCQSRWFQAKGNLGFRGTSHGRWGSAPCPYVGMGSSGAWPWGVSKTCISAFLLNRDNFLQGLSMQGILLFLPSRMGVGICKTIGWRRPRGRKAPAQHRHKQGKHPAAEIQTPPVKIRNKRASERNHFCFGEVSSLLRGTGGKWFLTLSAKRAITSFLSGLTCCYF